MALRVSGMSTVSGGAWHIQCLSIGATHKRGWNTLLTISFGENLARAHVLASMSEPF